MLPPGPQFVAYSAVSKQREVSPPVWFFLHLSPGEVVCRHWNPAVELLLPFEDQDEVLKLLLAVMNSLRLGPDAAQLNSLVQCRLIDTPEAFKPLISTRAWHPITSQHMERGKD